MTHRGAGLAALLVAGSLLLGACGTGGAVPRPVRPSPSTVAAATPEPYTSGQLAARREAAVPGCPASDPSVAARPDGLPDIVLECFGGDSFVRLAGLRGRPMVLNVWGQWCAPCRAEAPFLAEVANAYEGRVQFLGLDYADPDPERALAFAAAAGWRYPHVVDLRRVTQAPLSLSGLPQTLFVSAEGVVVGRHVGAFSSAAQLEDAMSRALGVGR